MSRYLLILVILCAGVAACSPAATVAEPQATAPDEAHGDDTELEAAHDAEAEEGETHDEDGDAQREHGAHEHGAATLSVAWSGNEMEVRIDTPAFNLFGFEYEPATAEEIQQVEVAVDDLESGGLLGVNDEAACRLAEAAVATAWSHEEEHADEANHEEEAETHSDVQAVFSLICDSPDDIRSLDLSALFNRFPNLEELDAQWVSDTSQSAAELTPGTPVLTLR